MNITPGERAELIEAEILVWKGLLEQAEEIIDQQGALITELLEMSTEQKLEIGRLYALLRDIRALTDQAKGGDQ